MMSKRPLALVVVLFMLAAGCSRGAASDDAATSAASGPGTPSPMSAAQVAFVVQCSEIVRAYDAWQLQIAWNFKWIDGTRDSYEAAYVAKEGLKDIKVYTDALYQAAQGRTDQPSKALAVAVADFEVERAMVALENTVGGKVKPQTYQKMRDAAPAVENALATFKLTCPPLQ